MVSEHILSATRSASEVMSKAFKFKYLDRAIVRKNGGGGSNLKLNESWAAFKGMFHVMKKIINQLLVRQFGSKKQNQLARAKYLPPLPQETIHILQSGAIRSTL